MADQNAIASRTNDIDIPAFPARRPAIKITVSDEAPFIVDCQELRAWSIIPRVGEQASSADYEYYPPDWKLSEVSVMQALRTATIHGVEGVEIETRVWKSEMGWLRSGTVCARLTNDKAEYLAVHLPHEKFTQIETFLDDSFAWNWGGSQREIADQGHLQNATDGSLSLSETSTRSPDTGIGFGVVLVEIGDKSFLCLRVLDIPNDGILSDDDGYYINVSYITRQGRTVLVRRYCRPGFAEIAEFPVTVDESDQIVINGLTFIHWYDTIMEITLQS